MYIPWRGRAELLVQFAGKGNDFSTRPDTAGLPVARLTGSAGNQRLMIEFVRRKIVALTYTVQFANSPVGASFQPAVNTPSVTPIDANWERMIVEDNATTGNQAIRFGRVRVTAP